MIISRQNSTIKKIRSLSEKKFRDELGLYVACGEKMSKEAFLSGKQVEYVICTQKGLSLCEGIAKEPIVVSDDVFKCLSYEVSPQGVLAVIKKPENTLEAPKGLSVFLDGVSDPANVGAIIRTAASAGYNDIYLADCADAFSPKSVRASMSGIYKVNLHVGSREELLKLIDCPIIIADMKGENVFNFQSPQKFCLVVGNESHGVSELLRKSATKMVSIPMKNEMESLNASVSAGILLYYLTLQD